MPDVHSLPGETNKQALIFSGKPPNLATTSCLSVATIITGLLVVTTWERSDLTQWSLKELLKKISHWAQKAFSPSTEIKQIQLI